MRLDVKTQILTSNRTMRRPYIPLFGYSQAFLRDTPKAVTPWAARCPVGSQQFGMGRAAGDDRHHQQKRREPVGRINGVGTGESSCAGTWGCDLGEAGSPWI